MPSAKVTRIVVAPSMTWNAVRIEPRVFTITPVPSPSASPFDEGPFVSITTIDGRIFWYTTAEVGGAACSSLIAFETMSDAIVPTCAESSGAGEPVVARTITATTTPVTSAAAAATRSSPPPACSTAGPFVGRRLAVCGACRSGPPGRAHRTTLAAVRPRVYAASTS